MHYYFYYYYYYYNNKCLLIKLLYSFVFPNTVLIDSIVALSSILKHHHILQTKEIHNFSLVKGFICLKELHTTDTVVAIYPMQNVKKKKKKPARQIANKVVVL